MKLILNHQEIDQAIISYVAGQVDTSNKEVFVELTAGRKNGNTCEVVIVPKGSTTIPEYEEQEGIDVTQTEGDTTSDEDEQEFLNSRAVPELNNVIVDAVITADTPVFEDSEF